MQQKLKKIGFWAAIILPALVMVGAGTSKLLGVEQAMASFKMMELPVWFGTFIGACEIAGGLGLLMAPLRALAAICLLPIMAGAIYFHLAYQVLSPAPAIVVVLLLLVVIKTNCSKAFWNTQKPN